tara:strand:- start:105464 stop:107443 length:1980 start_codon:yes stop_codon:yes gene_type:complete
MGFIKHYFKLPNFARTYYRKVSFFTLFFLLQSYNALPQSSPSNFKVILTDIIDEKEQSLEKLHANLEDFRRDTTAMKKLIIASEKVNYTLGEAYAENMLGIYFRDKSSYQRSIYHHKKSIALAKEIGNQEMEISALNMLGVVYRRMDAVRSALDNHQAALEMAENFTPKNNSIVKSIAISLNSIGNIYLIIGDYDLAENYFKQAIPYEEGIGSKLGLAINYGNLGITYEERGQFEKALYNYRQSLKYNEEINSELGILICNNSIGQVYLKQNKAEAAMKLIRPTIAMADHLEDEFYIAMAYINMGWALYELGNYAEAEKYFLTGERVSKKNEMKQFLSSTYEHLAQLKEKQGQYDKALDYQRLSQTVQKKYLNEENHKYVSDLNMKYDTEKKKNTIALLEKENEIVTMNLAQSNQNLIFLGLLFLFSFVIVYILFRQNKLKNEKTALKAEQKLMRSQMNPHFIFNALLSIKIYMQNHNSEDAIEYLNQFAKLVRSILSSSLEKEITLEEELETMQLYVNIENIRFCNEIIYDVKVDDDISLKDIKIPSLILQPFVENALWHGLQPKDGKKTLELKVSKKNENFVEISITDNGIGRKKTMEIPSDKRNTQKKSIGIRLTIQRLQNFSKNFAHAHSLNIIDLYDEGNNPKGTKVLLDLPVQ